MRVPDYPSVDPARWSAVDDYFSGLPTRLWLRCLLPTLGLAYPRTTSRRFRARCSHCL